MLQLNLININIQYHYPLNKSQINLYFMKPHFQKLQEEYDQFLQYIPSPYFNKTEDKQLGKILMSVETLSMKKKIKQCLELIGQFESVEQFQKNIYKLDSKILSKYLKKKLDIKRQFIQSEFKNQNYAKLLEEQQIIIEHLLLSHSKMSFINKLQLELEPTEIGQSFQTYQQILQSTFEKFYNINIIRNFVIKYNSGQYPELIFDHMLRNDEMNFRKIMSQSNKNKELQKDIQSLVNNFLVNEYDKLFQHINFLDQLTYGRKRIRQFNDQQCYGIEDYIIVKDQKQFDSFWKYLMANEIHQNQNISNKKLNIYKKQKNQKIPNEAIGNIISYRGKSEFYAIGFLISKNIVLTCAHAIIDKSTGKQYQKIIFMIEGKQYEPIRCYYPPEYVQSYESKVQHIAQKQRILNDFAIIQLGNDIDLSETYGYFGLYGKDLDESTTEQIELLGFMKDKENQSKQQCQRRLKMNELKHIQSKFKKSSYGNVVGYYADTLHGFSGSPGFITYQDNPFVISIHTNRINQNQFTQQFFSQKIQKYITSHIEQLKKQQQKFENKIKQKIINLIKKLEQLKKYKSLSNPIIIGTYIGEQVKQYLNKWINTKKLNLTNYQSNDMNTLMNIISKRNNGELYKIKHLILNKKNLKSSNIKKILQQCNNLFYMTILELQGNDLTQQFQSLTQMKYFRHLEHLNLNDTGISNKDIQLFKQFKYLGKLQIANKGGHMANKINHQTLEIFQGDNAFKLLKYLDISGYELSEEKIKQLNKKRPSLIVKY